MSCLCKCTNKKLNFVKPADENFSDGENLSNYYMKFDDTTRTSATELSFLKAEVWSLQASLREARKSEKNLSEAVSKLANEKYELLEELSNMKMFNQKLLEQLNKERDNQDFEKNVLLTEINDLQCEKDERDPLMEKLIRQNIGLKQTNLEANETIYQMGLIYMKLKNNKE